MNHDYIGCFFIIHFFYLSIIKSVWLDSFFFHPIVVKRDVNAISIYVFSQFIILIPSFEFPVLALFYITLMFSLNWHILYNSCVISKFSLSYNFNNIQKLMIWKKTLYNTDKNVRIIMKIRSVNSID